MKLRHSLILASALGVVVLAGCGAQVARRADVDRASRSAGAAAIERSAT